MKLFLILLFVGANVLAADSFVPYRAYLTNLEEDDGPVSVFKTPGQNWKYCKKDAKVGSGCVETVGWPGRDAKIKVLSNPVKAKARDSITGKTYTEEYVKVEYSYERKGTDGKVYQQTGIGYLESDYVAKKETKTFYTAQNTKKTADPCPPTTSVSKNKADPQSKVKDFAAKLSDLNDSINNFSIEKKANALAEVVGFCPLKPPTKPPRHFGKVNVYEQTVLPGLMKSRVPAVYNEQNRLITRDEMIQVDTLARTLYGEMARCYKRGLQYPMAVAKVILTRTENKENEIGFIEGVHSKQTPTLTKVCTSPNQFSMWLQRINGKPNDTLHHGLCPPRKQDEPFWASDQASKMESDIWKNTMRIATEAILYPTRFKARTKEVDGYFYTSGLGKFGKKGQFKKQSPAPTIEGQRLDRSECMEFWKKKE